MRHLMVIFLASVLCYFPVQGQIKFEKKTIDKTYVSESAAVADIDKDGLLDVVAGDVWYKAPHWNRMEIRPLGAYYGTLVDPTKPRGSGAAYYARCIGNYTQDIDGDGWLDVMVLNSQGSPAYWYRNPGGNFEELWQEYLAIDTFHNESPQYVDLFDDGNKVLLAGYKLNNRQYSLCWFEPDDDITKPWRTHTIGHPDEFNVFVAFRDTIFYAPGAYGHGLGTGDVNGDKITDVLTAKGWYEGVGKGRYEKTWKFHAFPFDTMADQESPGLTFAHMHTDDFNGDVKMDVIGSSAHRYGLWWYEQKDGKFVKHEISMAYSQLHSMTAADLDGDGQKEYITGKRFLAHLGRDPGWNDGAVILYVGKNKNGQLTTYVIDDDSASGTQIWCEDLNGDGLLDVISSNKKGTHLFYQQAKTK